MKEYLPNANWSVEKYSWYWLGPLPPPNATTLGDILHEPVLMSLWWRLCESPDINPIKHLEIYRLLNRKYSMI